VSDPRDPAAQPQIRILIVDGHPVLRSVVRTACDADPGMRVVAEAGEGDAALEECQRSEPDVVVLDLEVPGLDGLEVARRMMGASKPPGILVISERSDARTLFECIRLGVGGFLGKTAGLCP
jgi:DNA-binding NarL/FixJ family response regulator